MCFVNSKFGNYVDGGSLAENKKKENKNNLC